MKVGWSGWGSRAARGLDASGLGGGRFSRGGQESFAGRPGETGTDDRRYPPPKLLPTHSLPHPHFPRALGCAGRGAAMGRSPSHGVEPSAGGGGWKRRSGAALGRYFDAGRGSAALADALPCAADAHMARPDSRLSRACGLPPAPCGETLLVFFASAAQTGASKSSDGGRCLRDGTARPFFPILPSRPSCRAFRRCRPWEELALLPESALRGLPHRLPRAQFHPQPLFSRHHPGWLEAARGR